MSIYIPQWVIAIQLFLIFAVVALVLLWIISSSFWWAMRQFRAMWIVSMALTFRKYGPSWNYGQMHTMAYSLAWQDMDKCKEFRQLWEDACKLKEEGSSSCNAEELRQIREERSCAGPGKGGGR